MNQRLIIIALLGFSSGIPLFLTSSTLSIWLKELGYGNTTIGFFAIASLPYALKFFWAPLIDRMPLPFLNRVFGRRRSWLILSQVGLMLCLLSFWAFGPSIKLTWLTVFAAATQEALMLVYQMESIPKSQYGPGDAIGVFGFRIGMLLSGAGAIYLSTLMSWGLVYAIMALCVGIGFITTLCISEPKPGFSKQAFEQEKRISEYLHSHPSINKTLASSLSWAYAAYICPFSNFMSQGGCLAALGIMFLYKLGDNLIGSMPNIMYLELGFSKDEIAHATKLFGMIASMAGGIAGGYIISRIGFVQSLLHFGILHMAATFMYILTFYSGHNLTILYIAIALEHITSGMRTTALFTYQLTLCNPLYAATQLALLTSLVHLGRTLFASMSGWLVDTIGWVNFYNLSVVGSIPSLLICIYLIKINAEPLYRRPILAR